MTKLSEAERAHRAATRKKNDERAQAEEDFKSRQTAAQTLALLQGGGAKAIEIAPAAALGLAVGAEFRTPNQISHLLVFPLYALQFRIGPVVIGVPVEDVRKAYENALLQMFQMGPGFPGEVENEYDTIPIGGSVLIAALTTVSTLMLQDFVRSIASTIHEVMLKAIP